MALITITKDELDALEKRCKDQQTLLDETVKSAVTTHGHLILNTIYAHSSTIGWTEKIFDLFSRTFHHPSVKSRRPSDMNSSRLLRGVVKLQPTHGFRPLKVGKNSRL